MTASTDPQPRTAAWYFIAATFIATASVFARTLLDAQVLANLMLAVAAGAAVLGAIVAMREHRTRRDAGSSDHAA